MGILKRAANNARAMGCEVSMGQNQIKIDGVEYDSLHTDSIPPIFLPNGNVETLDNTQPLPPPPPPSKCETSDIIPKMQGKGRTLRYDHSIYAENAPGPGLFLSRLFPK